MPNTPLNPLDPSLGDFNLGFNNILASNANSSNLLDMATWSPVMNPFGATGMAPTNTPNAGVGFWSQGIGEGFKNIWKGMGSENFQSSLGGFANLANIYMGFKALGLMKDQMKFAKTSFKKNYNAQAQTYNNELKNDWEAKNNAYASRGMDYTGKDSWMNDRQIGLMG